MSANQIANPQLATEALSFLQGTKTSEAQSSQLADALYVVRKLGTGEALDSYLARKIVEGKSLVLTGSAGGGKTMLLHRIQHMLDARPDTEIFVTYIEDFVACGASDEERARTLLSGLERGPIVVAANEGPLLTEAVREVLPGVVGALRSMQSGDRVTQEDESMPFVVVDMAALDPVVPAISQLLANDILRAAVVAHEAQSCHQFVELGTCPRVEALQQLDVEGMPEFVEHLVQLGTSAREVLFRHIWDFVADLLIGGSCEGPVPTSPWFWRLFYGRRVIADELREALQPQFLAMPRGLPYLFQADWIEVDKWQPAICDLVVDAGVKPAKLQAQEAVQIMRWYKIQFALLMRSNGQRLPIFPGEEAASLERSVTSDGRVDRLTQHMNAYFSREKVTPRTPTDLTLWVDTALQRKEERSKAMLGLGTVPTGSLELRNSRVVSSLSDRTAPGSRVFLKAKGDSRASLPLVPRIFEALIRGRSISYRDGEFEDVDYSIRDFYLHLCGSNLISNPDTLRLLDTSGDSPVRLTWRIPEASHIELVSGS